MEQNTLRKQRELTDRLNRYRNEYYNYNNPSVSDEVYDRLFDELHKLEQETGIQMSNSPTVTVGYPVVGKLEKTAHKIPLLSLDKVKSSVDLCRFMGDVPFPVSWTVKMKKKQKETQDILSYHTQAAGCSDKARAKASGGRQPIEECGRTGL